jgi:pyridoxamine 5'-phosphate oxidase family protein
MFTEKELDYIRSQPLARLATVDGEGQPDVAAVGFRFDGRAFVIIGANLPASRKYKNVAGGRPKVALIIDDLASVDPWNPRGVRVYGRAKTTEAGGRPALVIVPDVSWSWNIEGPAFQDGRFVTNRIVHG